MKNCVDGSRVHENCEDVEHGGRTLVVCHDCKQTLGVKTEVYSRVCGYMRPVSGWNPGKQQEHAKRTPFVMKMPS